MFKMHPTLISFGPITIYSYGLLLAIGSAVAIWRAAVKSGRVGLSPANIVDAGVIIVLAGLVGGRLTYVALNWSSYSSNWREIPAVWDGGLTFFGGLAAGALAGVLWAVRAKISVAAFADLLAPSLALGYAISRLGCFLNGCCYGSPTSWSWAVKFHENGGPFLTPPSHPAQIYSSILSFIVFLFLVVLEKRNLPAGSLIGSWLILSSLERFFVEYFRKGVTATVVAGGFTQAQLVCLVLILVGAGIIYIARDRGLDRG